MSEGDVVLTALDGIEGYFEELGTPMVEGVPSPGATPDWDLLDRVAPKYGLEIVERHAPGGE